MKVPANMRAMLLSVLVIGALIATGLVGGSLLSRTLDLGQVPLDVSHQWHQGDARTTDDLDIEYTTEYTTVPQDYGDNVKAGMGRMVETMWINYADGSEARVGLQLISTFKQGGLDVAGGEVLDWSLLTSTNLMLHSYSMTSHGKILTMYTFSGFQIMAGNASDLSISKQSLGGDNYAYKFDDVLGTISYFTSSIAISDVEVTASGDLGKADRQTTARFSVSLDAELTTDPLGNSSHEGIVDLVPTVLSFEVNHNSTRSEFKYGADLDWSSVKDLSLLPGLEDGEPYCLAAVDILEFYGYDVHLTEFTTDRGNGSAIYTSGGEELCRQVFTSSYLIAGSEVQGETDRTYIADADRSGNEVRSGMFVVFGGLVCNESTGLEFDPSVISPSYIPSNGGSLPWGIVLAAGAIVAVVLVTAVLLMRKRRR